jgi:hypothetical protein
MTTVTMIVDVDQARVKISGANARHHKEYYTSTIPLRPASISRPRSGSDVCGSKHVSRPPSGVTAVK